MGNKVAVGFDDSNDDDLIIVEGLQKIKQGVLNADLQLICDGYNHITGDEIQPVAVKKKNRVEKIRELMKNSDTPKEKPVTKKPVKRRGKNTIDSLKKELLDLGFTEDELEDQTKEQMEQMLAGDNVQVQKGGKRFGKGKIQIITAGFDEEEFENNKIAHKKALKFTGGPVKRNTSLPKDNSDDPNAGFRVYSNNTKKIENE